MKFKYHFKFINCHLKNSNRKVEFFYNLNFEKDLMTFNLILYLENLNYFLVN